ncbi:MAG: hypothetical protein QG632_216, partial [Candidatus Dependentiae bacterium]|nr:hypothetical protein [Candidatus Dependentiae bacterium]
MKKLLCIISIFSCATLSLHGSGIVQSLSDWNAKRAINKTLAAKTTSENETDSDDLFSSFAAKYLASYGLYSTDLEAILAQIKKTNTERERSYSTRTKPTPPTVCETFKNYRLMAERYLYPNIPELLKTSLQALKVLAASGDETLANVREKIEKKYEDNEPERNKKLKVLAAAEEAIKGQQKTLLDYFSDIKITPSSSPLTSDQI